MFKIIDKKEMIAKIDVAINGDLQEMAMMFPDLKEKMIKNMYWGIFAKEFIHVGKEPDKRRHDYVTHFSYKLVELAEKELEISGEKEIKFFNDEVKEIIKGKDFSIFLDYEDSDVLVEVETKNKEIKEQELIIAVTIPDSGIIFADYIEGHWFDDKNQWIIEYMDKYDSFKHEVMQSLFNYFIQIGGHGRWIQNDYNGSYVAQYNMDIGDAGSIFLEAKDKSVKAYVDMF